MESLTVLYQVSDEFSSDGFPNAFTLLVQKDKEVFLLDILQYLKTYTQLGINFLFKADCKEAGYLLLESPSSIVPVFDQEVSLLLIPCGACPIVPVGQTREWIQKSRLELYSNYKRAAPVLVQELRKEKKSMGDKAKEKAKAIASKFGFGKSKTSNETPFSQV